jgi:predicted outer membrane repeat protein
MSKVLVVCAVATALLFLPASSSRATTYLVKNDGTGDFATIADAVAAASGGDVIELADGTFTGDGNRDISFLGKAITIRSVSGNPGACNLRVDGEEMHPHRGFLFESGEGSDSVLEGIMVRFGYAFDEMAGGRGGAVLVTGASSPTIRDCIFRANQALGAPGGGVGGGARIEDDSSPEFTGCLFENNGAYFGGAVHAEGAGDVSFTDCVFAENDAYMGGAIYAQGGSFTLTGCTFGENLSVGATGVRFYGATGAVSSCTFCKTGLSLACPSAPLVENTLVAFQHVECGDAEPEFVCCDLWSSDGLDWVPPFDDQLGVSGNVCANPLFCATSPSAERDWTVYNTSPCLPAQSGCGLIGRWGIGCFDTPVEPESWSGVKALYR